MSYRVVAKIEKFEDIKAWKKARVLVRDIHNICNIEQYKRDYNLVDQNQRAALSIMANIAAGFARRTKKEFINSLGIAHASAAELQAHLYVALDQNYISDEEFNLLYEMTEEVSKMIQGFSSYLKNPEKSNVYLNSQTPKLPNSIR